jgi:hypothetical protein
MRSSGRELLAVFFCDEGGKPWLNALSVSEPKGVNDKGEEYRSLDHYDVEWCKRDGCYLYHMSGGGGRWPQQVEGLYWRTDGFRVKERAAKWCAGDGDGIDYAKTKYIRLRNRTRRLSLLPKAFRGAKHYEHNFPGKARVTSGDLLDWLGQNARQEDAVFCCECADDLPADDLCEHCWWCDSIGWYVTPQEGEACFSVDCWGCRQHRRAKHEAHRDQKRQARFAAYVDSLSRPEVSR